VVTSRAQSKIRWDVNRIALTGSRVQFLSRCGNAWLRCGSSEMQGYRKQNEDQHNMLLSLGKHSNLAFFAVYDGHAGKAAAMFLHDHLSGEREGDEKGKCLFDQASSGNSTIQRTRRS
jgi:hypothetical protein